MEEDNQIIELVLRGKRDEFQQLINKYKDLIYSLVYRQLGNHSDAEEITQDVFTKAFLNLASFEKRAKFSTWLYRIAINTTNSFYSSRVYKERMRTKSFDIEKHEISFDQVERDNISREEIGLFQKALAKLKPIFREVLVLCALEGHSYEEVALMLGVPVGTIRSRLNTARLSIKEEMKNLVREF